MSGVLAGLLCLVHESRRAFKERHRPEGSIYFLTDRALTAPSKPLRRVRKSCILLFVAVQLLAFGMTFMIMQTIAAAEFLVIILMLIPLRTLVVPRLSFSDEELRILDQPTASLLTI
ncbi:hypothetical protein B0F90DRAFT_1821228 [Multifurca ochricompacta]|uniref:Bicarbonate transporter-like transmembrane domain-containing protein n=1 Tax=Multifurca ochricompacta TaxID=376703 RepID=A0AAD4LYE4_9AGAM|nr:hypothetical protein B0F90DRAFT_1821228 [Multifurca ochricompacta]